MHIIKGLEFRLETKLPRNEEEIQKEGTHYQKLGYTLQIQNKSILKSENKIQGMDPMKYIINKVDSRVGYDNSQLNMKIYSLYEKVNNLQTDMYDLINKQDAQNEVILDL